MVNIYIYIYIYLILIVNVWRKKMVNMMVALADTLWQSNLAVCELEHGP